jgi:hypothetical protein
LVRGRGRKPINYENLVTKDLKEDEASYCRAISRKFKKDIASEANQRFLTHALS